MDYINKIRVAANLCEDVDAKNSEYLRGICEFIADTEELDEEEYGEGLDSRSQGVRIDIEMMIAMLKQKGKENE